MTQVGFDYASVDDNTDTDGIDAGHDGMQDSPNFEQAKAAGARFGVIRSIYGRQSGGGCYRDPDWARDHKAASDTGLVMGSYLFLCAPVVGKATPEPEEQAQALINYVGRELHPGTLPPFVDVEEASTLSASAYYDWVLRACRVLRHYYGTWPGIYTSQRVWTEYLKNHAAGELKECPLWIAKPWPWPERTPVHLDGAPSYSPNLVAPWGSQWFLYQYQGDGTGWPGFSKTTDVNRFNVLTQGAKSDAVAWMQRKLNTYLMGALPTVTPLVCDGIYGAKTGDALRMFQSARGLTADGVYGVASHAQLAWVCAA